MSHPIARIEDIDWDEAATLYLVGSNATTLGQKYGCSPTTVSKRLQKRGIRIRGPKEAIRGLTCTFCGTEAVRTSPKAIYCSRKCAVDAANHLRSERCRLRRLGKLCPCGEAVPSDAYQALYCSKACGDQAQNLRRRLRNRGISLEHYNDLLERQEHRCAICRSEDWGDKDIPRIDHDHETGRVRGLLCNTCNLVLGMFGDDSDRLGAAIAYLREGD